MKREREEMGGRAGGEITCEKSEKRTQRRRQGRQSNFMRWCGRKGCRGEDEAGGAAAGGGRRDAEVLGKANALKRMGKTWARGCTKT